MSFPLLPLEFAQPQRGVVAFSTLRGAANAADPYSEVNLCDYTGGSPLAVLAARTNLASQLQIPLGNLVMPRQRHTASVFTVTASHMAPTTVQRAVELDGVDALVTALRGVCIGVNTADCVPVVLSDDHAHVVGVAHAGWRGTVARIARTTVEAMVRLGADPQRVAAVMGPSIGPECFEVGQEVYDAFAQAGFDMARCANLNGGTGKWHIDLQQANTQVLREAGLPAGNIEWCGECSRCNPTRHFSARLLGIGSGRTFTGIMMK